MKAQRAISHSSDKETFRKWDTALKQGSRRKEMLRDKNPADVFYSLQVSSASFCASNRGEEEVLVQDKQTSRPWVILWWDLFRNWHSIGFRNSWGNFKQFIPIQSPEVTLYLSNRGWTTSFFDNEYTTPYIRDGKAIISVFNYSPLFMINSVTFLTQHSWVCGHTVTFGFASQMVLARDCEWAGSLAGSSSIYYIATKGSQHPESTQKYKHSHYSLARILTLSGDEVVGSMVALKERRGMTCWVSHLRLRHSCIGGYLSVSPLSLPFSLHSALLLTHSAQLWIAFPV